MGRWTQYDEDEYRLPEGMKRTGYDADTGRYSYRSRSGAIWEGAHAAEYGVLNRVSGIPTSPSNASPSCSGTKGGRSDSTRPRSMARDSKAQTKTRPFRNLSRIYHAQWRWVKCVFGG